MKPRWKKGVILLQTMIMALILSMVSVMLMKWVLARYMMAARSYRSTAATATAVGNSQKTASEWNFSTTAASCGTVVNGQTITCAGGRITITADED
ncbi:MAG: hypothetical protein Q7R35_13885 [Elusimicrobiota bacterium]|nr:hypothetical protein [Elusimicrobiota bacterium]